MAFKVLRLDQLIMDSGTQSRADQVPDSVVQEYMGLRADGVVLPPISVVSDGVHHWPTGWLYSVSGWKNPSVTIRFRQMLRPGLSKMRYGRRSPQTDTHGVARTNADKRKAVLLALAHPHAKGMKSREIAKHTGVHHSTVCAILNEQKVGSSVGIRQEAVACEPSRRPKVSDRTSVATEAAPEPSACITAEQSGSGVVPEKCRVQHAPGDVTGDAGGGEPVKPDTVSGKRKSRKARTPAQEMVDIQKELGALERHIDNFHRETGQDMLYNRARASFRQVAVTLSEWAKAVEPF